MQNCTIERISDLDALLAKNLKVRRTLKGISQYKLSEKTGLSQSLIAKIEKCKRKITATELFLIAEGLETNVGEFYNDSLQFKD